MASTRENSNISKYLVVDPDKVKQYLANILETKPTLMNMILTVLHAIALGILYKLYKDAAADKARLEKQQFENDDHQNVEDNIKDPLIG